MRVRPNKDEHGLARREIEAVAGTTREEAHVLVRLAEIRLEVKWQSAVGLARCYRRGRDWFYRGRAAGEKRREHEDPPGADKAIVRHSSTSRSLSAKNPIRVM